MRVLSIILGVILLIGGIELAVRPFETSLAVSSIVPIFLCVALLVAGITGFVRWGSIKKAGGQNGFVFWDALLCLLFGLLLLFSWTLRSKLTIAMVVLIPILVAVFVLFTGISHIVTSIQTRKLSNVSVERGGVKIAWGWELALGILATLLGIFTIINPLTSIVAVGIFVGIDIMFAGITLMITGFAA